VEDQEDEVGKVEHVRQVEHLEVAAHPEHGKNYAAFALEVEHVRQVEHLEVTARPEHGKITVRHCARNRACESGRTPGGDRSS
jgi:hypothetical protein